MKYYPANCTKDGRKSIQSTTRLCYVLSIISPVLTKTHSWDGAGSVEEQSTNGLGYQKTRLKNTPIVWSTTPNLSSVLKVIYQDQQKGNAMNTSYYLSHTAWNNGARQAALPPFLCLNSMNSDGSKVAVSGGSKATIKVGQKLLLEWVKSCRVRIPLLKILGDGGFLAFWSVMESCLELNRRVTSPPDRSAGREY